MKLNKYLAAGCLAASAIFVSAASSFAQDKAEVDNYIKTFGFLVGERSGLSELQFTDAEFAVFVEGMKTALSGAKAPADMQAVGEKMSAYLRDRADKNLAEIAKKNEEKSASFWKDLDNNKKIVKTPSGLAYEIKEQGKAPMPTDKSVVTINYTGKLINGEVFDSSANAGQPAVFPLDKVIAGFREGLQKIGKGGKITLYIPAKLGYGNQALPGIPAGSTLIFDVDLLDVADAPAQPEAPVVPQIQQN